MATACSAVPDGDDHWTVRLLPRKPSNVVWRKASRPNHQHHAKKNFLTPWQKQQWCIPSADAAFVAAMEDVLDLYADAYNAAYPVVCFDEKRVLLLADSRPPLPVQPEHPCRQDYAYERHGERNLFMLVEPKGGYQHSITAQRCRQDDAHSLKWLVDEGYPQATVIRVVQDNVNPHTPASLYATFAPAVARRLVQKLEFHDMPKHGNWLNMTEIEIGVFKRQCLAQRLGMRQHCAGGWR